MARANRLAGLWRWAPWVWGSALCLLLFRTDFIHADGIRLEGKAVWGRDFVNLWAGGRLLRERGVEALYDLDRYHAYLATLFGPLKPHNYSYPPVTFPIAELFGLLPYGVALAAWLIGTGALFVWAARKWWPAMWGPAWLALLTPAALMNIWAGHYGFLLGALFLAGWSALDRHPRRTGLCFGLMLVKPHLALLIPLALLVRRQWLATVAGAITVAILLVATSLLYGWSAWGHFLFGTSAVQAGLIDAGGSFFGNMSTSLATAILRFSDNLTLALGAQAVLGAAAVAGLVVAARRAVPTMELAMLVATATFLVLPYAFNYDLTVVTIAALRLWADPAATRGERRLAIAGFVAPQIGMLVAPLGVPATPLMLAALFAGQLSLALRRASAAPAAPAAAAGAHSI